METIKVILFNTGALIVSVFKVGAVMPEIKEILQIILVAVTIGYTIFKFQSDYRKKKK